MHRLAASWSQVVRVGVETHVLFWACSTSLNIPIFPVISLDAPFLIWFSNSCRTPGFPRYPESKGSPQLRFLRTGGYCWEEACGTAATVGSAPVHPTRRAVEQCSECSLSTKGFYVCKSFARGTRKDAPEDSELWRNMLFAYFFQALYKCSKVQMSVEPVS